MRELLSRGIGVHHGGLLPLVKGTYELAPRFQADDTRGRGNSLLARSCQGPFRDRDFRYGGFKPNYLS